MRIGITGGIGAGKSYVARLLTELFGIPVYDCDREAKRLMTSSSAMKAQLQELVGTASYLPDGSLNKPLLAQYLFADEEHARRVNAIVHPAVKSDFGRWAEQQRQAGVAVMALESAILIAAGMRDVVDVVLYVDAPQELRISRAMQRDAATREEIEQRIKRQVAETAYRQAADFIVVNDGRDLSSQLERIIQFITKDKQNHA